VSRGQNYVTSSKIIALATDPRFKNIHFQRENALERAIHMTVSTSGSEYEPVNEDFDFGLHHKYSQLAKSDVLPQKPMKCQFIPLVD
ncbi:hypothetical protein WA026_012684, partial [Henosepilachna vigintioctopunctata]